jgi:hypothetical protein
MRCPGFCQFDCCETHPGSAPLRRLFRTLGDYVDRGPDGRKIIERLMAGLERDGGGNQAFPRVRRSREFE